MPRQPWGDIIDLREDRRKAGQRELIISGGVFQTRRLTGLLASSAVVLHRNCELASLKSFYGVLRLQEHSGGDGPSEPLTAPPAVTHTPNNPHLKPATL